MSAFRNRFRPSRPLVCDTPRSDAAACSCCDPRVGSLNARLGADLSRRMFVGGGAALVASFAGIRASEGLAAVPPAPGRPVHFTNLRLFDGVDGKVREGVGILVRGNRIAAIVPAAEKVEGAQVVDCGGRLAMPGLIDAHWHSLLCGVTMAAAMTAELPFLHLVAARAAQDTLMRGFTTVRDAGGPAFALKRAIDAGIVAGPRIYPSGAMVSQTSGHGDFRMLNELPRGATTPSTYTETSGVAAIADGEAEVLRRVREQLMQGASQIKMMAGGGVASPYDPIDVTQYTERELRAGVEAAADWGTYVMVHVYTPRGIQRAIRAGVKCIEHGQLADEESVRMMAGEGIWWSLQPFLGDEDSNERADPRAAAKAKEVAEGTVRAYELSLKHKVRTAWGTDILFSPDKLRFQTRHLAKLAPRFYAPLEALGIATARNGELLRLSGPRNPYDGALGTIAQGALADILIAEGDPGRNLDFLLDPAANLKVIMKDGRLYKNTL